MELCGAVEPSRAVWVVEALTPLNLDQLDGSAAPVFPAAPGRDAEWSVAARAVALPRRWLVVGRRAGAEVLRAWTAEVADRLDVSPAPDLEGPGVAGDVELQDTARWMVDFDEAERCGMAVRIAATDVVGGLEAGVDQLLVIGLDWDLSPFAAAGSIRRLFAHHAYTDGLSAIAPGTPTNVTASSRPGRPRPTSGSSWRWTPSGVPPPAPSPGPPPTGSTAPSGCRSPPATCCRRSPERTDGRRRPRPAWPTPCGRAPSGRSSATSSARSSPTAGTGC